MWIYIVFAVYFWVEAFLIILEVKSEYEFTNDYDFFYMFIATIGIAVSLTVTAIYLIFYSMSK